jgi:hypothetical protein
MRRVLRRRPSAATTIAFIALMVALSGTAVGDSVERLISGDDIARNTITSKHVKNRSLLAKDFRAGQLPRGEQGPTGPRGEAGANGDRGEIGPTGPQGQTGTVDTSQFYDKTESDARFAKGNARVIGGQGVVDLTGVIHPLASFKTLATIPGFGNIRVGGALQSPNGDCRLEFINTSGGGLYLDGGFAVAPNEVLGLGSLETQRDLYRHDVTLSDMAMTKSLTAMFQMSFGYPWPDPTDRCTSSIHMIVSG